MVSIGFVSILIGICFSNLAYFSECFYTLFYKLLKIKIPLYGSVTIDKPVSLFFLTFGSAIFAVWLTEITLKKHYNKLETLQNQNKDLQDYNRIRIYPVIRTTGEFGMRLAQSVLFLYFNGTTNYHDRCLELAKRSNIPDLKDLTDEFFKKLSSLPALPLLKTFLDENLPKFYLAFQDVYGESIAASFRLSFSLVIMQHDVRAITPNIENTNNKEIERATDVDKNIIPTLEKIEINQDVKDFLIKEFKLFKDENHLISHKDDVNKFINLTLKYLQELDIKVYE
jgi:hypothetical protein